MFELINASPPEPETNYYSGIRLEPAQHGRGSHDVGSGKVWNPELTDRLASYRPMLLAIDSIQPIGEQREPLGIYQQRLVYDYFPSEPREISPESDAVYVLGGDVIRLYGPIVRATIGTDSGIKGEDFSNEINDQWEELETRALTNYMSDTAVIMGAAITIFACFQAVANSQKLATDSDSSKETLSRRDFLKLAGSTALVLGIGGILVGRTASIVSAKVTSESLKESLIKIANTLSPPDANWEKGRTALLVAKSQDAIDFLNLPKDSPCGIVMGSNHVFDQKVLEDDAVKKQAIHDLAKFAIDFADKAFEDAGEVNQEYRKLVLTALLNLFSDVDIYRVENKSKAIGIPDYPFGPSDVQLAAQFRSTRVETCISDLR